MIQISPSKAAVLIAGESGTDKELVALAMYWTVTYTW
ncbi:sigma 54-interacting transcriptional regulator [Moritella yayanosii]